MQSLGLAIADFTEAVVEDAAVMFFDTREPFEKWLMSLCATPQYYYFEDESISFEGFRDSNCEVVFDGILRVDGLLKGNIRSTHGTLVMTDQGRVEADVDVRIAIIDGCLEGNLKASEQVVLNSGARVNGNIHTPSLSVKDGALFEGNVFFLRRNVYSDFCGAKQEAEMTEAMAAAGS